MPPHQHGQHAQPRPQLPLRNAEELGIWHEPARIRRRRHRWRDIISLAVVVAAFAMFAWTLPATRPQPDATLIAGRVGR